MKILDVNLLRVMEVTLSLLSLVWKARGHVVNVFSVMGLLSLLGGGYCMSKYGVEAFSDSFRYWPGRGALPGSSCFCASCVWGTFIGVSFLHRPRGPSFQPLSLCRSFIGKHLSKFWVSGWAPGLESLLQSIPALDEGPQSESI